MAWTRDIVLDFLQRHAPKAPISDCMDLAWQVDHDVYEVIRLKEMLAIASTLILDDNGSPTIDTDRLRPAALLAIKELQNCHAWVNCGPVPDAMERLMKKHEADSD